MLLLVSATRPIKRVMFVVVIIVSWLHVSGKSTSLQSIAPYPEGVHDGLHVEHAPFALGRRRHRHRRAYCEGVGVMMRMKGRVGGGGGGGDEGNRGGGRGEK